MLYGRVFSSLLRTTSLVVSLLLYGAILVLGLLPFISTALPTSYLTLFKLVLGSAPAWSNFIKGMITLRAYGAVFISLAAMRFAIKEL